MSKQSRAAWRSKLDRLQAAYERAENRGDEKAMKKIYAEIEDHHYDRHVVDAVVTGVTGMRDAVRDARAWH